MIRDSLARARAQFVEDLREDPYLLYILLAAAVLMLFWIWHRLPNFATRDERWRVADPMEVVAFYLRDQSVQGIKDGVQFWRPYGATLYLYGLAVAPVIGFAAVTGQLEVFADTPGWRYTVDHFSHWQSTPGWVWYWSVLFARITNAVLAVGSVYVIYRIGTLLRDRATGRLAAILLSLCWAVIVLAHEAGEDVPAMFCFLVTVYLGIRYVENGSLWTFLQACVFGGLAIAFKISAGLGAIMLGVAFFLRMRREYGADSLTDDRLPGLPELVAIAGLVFGLFREVGIAVVLLVLAYVMLFARARVEASDPDERPTRFPAWVPLSASPLTRSARLARTAALFRPRLLVFGAATGIVTIFLGYPHSFVDTVPDFLIERIGRGTSSKGSYHGWLVRPTSWWITRSYLNGLGFPLAVASLGGIAATIPRLRERSLEAEGVTLVLSGVVFTLLIISGWNYVRTHHILLVFPLVVVLTAVALQRLRSARPKLGRVTVALLVVTTGIYAGVGTFGYATQPRDQSAQYLLDNSDGNLTVETYSWDSQEAGVPHSATIYRPSYKRDTSRSEWLQNVASRCPDYVAVNYQRGYLWLAPDNHSALSARWTGSGDAAYIHDILSEEGPYLTDAAPYPYEVVKEFGPKPFYVQNGGRPIDETRNALRAGLYPRTIQYGDPQDFGVYNHVTILKRTGNCTGN